jgi:hypothetical protein
MLPKSLTIAHTFAGAALMTMVFSTFCGLGQQQQAQKLG